MAKLNTDKSLRRIQILGFASIFVMGALIGSWTMLAQLNSAVIAGATVVSESYSKRIQHRDGGIVDKILVRDGDTVKAGQDLVVLDPTETASELGIIQGLLDESLIRRARLEAQRDGSRELDLPEEVKIRSADKALDRIISGQKNLLISTSDAVKGKRDQFLKQIGQLREQIEGISAQIESKTTQARLIAEELKNLIKLRDQGLVPVSRVLATEREAASLGGEQGELKASRASAESRIGEVEIEIIQLEESNRNQALTELREAEAKIIELKERRISTQSRLTRMVIKAPQDGTIYQMAVHTEGGVISPGETLMLLVPEGDTLVLQAQVAPQDVDQVQKGQVASVRFPGLNARTTPEIFAEVSQVAADVSQSDQNTPPFYAVRLMIPPKELEKLSAHKLRPGMNAEAFIQTEAQSPFSYFVRPLLDQFAYAMRET